MNGESAVHEGCILSIPFFENHRVLQGGAPEGATTLLTFPSAPDPFFKASKAPTVTLRVATPSGAPRQAPLEKTPTEPPSKRYLPKSKRYPPIVDVLCPKGNVKFFWEVWKNLKFLKFSVGCSWSQGF